MSTKSLKFGLIAVLVFLCTLSVRDLLISLGYLSGDYLFSLYLIGLGLFTGFYVLEQSSERIARARLEQERARKMESFLNSVDDLVHDLRNPLSGLKMACVELEKNPSNEELVLALARSFPPKADTLLGLTTTLSDCARELVSNSSGRV